jgi:hypothetical protein
MNIFLTYVQLPGYSVESPAIVVEPYFADRAADRLVSRFNWDGDRYVAFDREGELVDVFSITEAQNLELLAEGRMMQIEESRKWLGRFSIISVSIHFSKRLEKFVVSSPLGGEPVKTFKEAWVYSLDLLAKQQ